MFKKYIELFEKSVLKTLLWFFFPPLLKQKNELKAIYQWVNHLQKKKQKNPLILGDHMSGQFQKFQDSPVASTSNSSSMVTKW